MSTTHRIPASDATQVGYSDLRDLKPLEQSADCDQLLPLVPECTRPTYGDCGRRGVCAA